MKENIVKLRCFNLVNEEGRKLRLYLGLEEGYEFTFGPDKGFRWCFEGGAIPMPVRSGEWFNGFPEATMMNWLMDHGWYPETVVDMNTGRSRIFNITKGNENHAPAKPNHDTSLRDNGTYKNAFNAAIRHLVDNHMNVIAIRVYRYVHGGSLVEARDAVNEIYAHIDN